MSTSAAYITVTEQTIVTVQLPRTVYNLTDPQTVEQCLRHYYRLAHNAMEWQGGCFPVETLRLVAEAMVDGGAVTVLYRNEKDEVTARTIFPHSITLTNDKRITCYGYCTYRQQCRSFRLDAMKCVQVVTTPAEAAPVAA
jgi:WYL domain